MTLGAPRRLRTYRCMISLFGRIASISQREPDGQNRRVSTLLARPGCRILSLSCQGQTTMVITGAPTRQHQINWWATDAVARSSVAQGYPTDIPTAAPAESGVTTQSGWNGVGARELCVVHEQGCRLHLGVRNGETPTTGRVAGVAGFWRVN
jgi:hypothetical protein